MLGDMLSEIMDNRIRPQREKFDSISQLWSELLPSELNKHCRIASIDGGQLKVLVDSPSYMYDLQLYKSKILMELRRWCPSVRINKIKLALA